MAGEKILAMCHFGGVFVYNSDESMSYVGEEAHAIEITREMKFSDFKSEISSMFNSNTDPLTIKYFLPKNKTNYITVCNDIDLKRMVDIYADSGTTDVYVLKMNGTMIRRAPDDSGTSTDGDTVALPTLRDAKRRRLNIAAREHMIMLRMSLWAKFIHKDR
ncbi:hypothetical protein J5N97_021279 [Dioscorea zingiberensis]|uniref:PB1 domain-containing protein n=1 Tax=Dioscorea zingiberensis TaxID=325984 RepID=A0A9D5HEF9_9LILI|nr:hypothetical protein J5N97_021279 [Dioscorea zingiberensis]